MTNDEMKVNRFGRWYQARKKINAILTHIQGGGIVVIATHTKAMQYSQKHANMFKATKTGAYVQHGKRWDCIDYCAIKLY